jgi:hypothetical protein
VGDCLNRSLLVAALFAAAPAFAQWPSDKPKAENKPADTTTTTTAAPAPAPTPPPSRRQAQRGPAEDDGSGFGLGLRGAYAWPMGGLTGDEDLSASVSWQLPVWLEAGYHLNRNLYLGAYYQYAFGHDNCPAGIDCSSHAMRFGIEGIYTFATGAIQPWAGLGVGYERLSRSRGGDSTTFTGLELLNLQVGLDFAMGKMTFGPFASYQLLGKYSSFDANGRSNDIGDSRGHSWLQLGLKLGFTL